MSGIVRVKSVDGLKDLRSRLSIFNHQMATTIHLIEQEMMQQRLWIDQQIVNAKHRLQNVRVAVQHAERNFELCRAYHSRNGQGGSTFNTSSCQRESQIVQKTRRELRLAEQSVQNAEYWSAQMDKAFQSYYVQLRRFRTVSIDVAQPTDHFLAQSIGRLQSYLVGGNIGGDNPTAPIRPSAKSSTVALSATLVNSGQELGFQTVAISDIDLSDSHVSSSDDFHKVSMSDMQAGLQKLQSVVAPAVAQGKDKDYFRELDQANGLSYPDGYLRIYEAFYGDSPIRLEKIGGRYQVINGYHRLFVAQKLGIASLPANVITVQP